jgi:Dullard-like phosphatase family protein
LDETLVRYEINETNPDEANVILRPGLFYFLNKVYPLFDLVIWTVATKEYADPIIDIIEEKKKYFIARLFREHATFKNNIYIKDLTNLGRDISSIIIIDDKEISFSLQKQNGILIKPFYGTYSEVKNDFVLYDLFTIITKIILDKSKDVRQGINKYQYEIKQKVTKNYAKFNNNKVEENVNNPDINNSYDYNFNKSNDSFNNSNINYKAINRFHSINESSGYNNNILRK